MNEEVNFLDMLPPDISFSYETGLAVIKSGKQIGNFMPLVINCVRVIEDEEIIPSVKFKLIFMDGSVSEANTRPLKDLVDIEWFAIDPRCLINPAFSKAKDFLSYIIRSAIPKVSEVVEYHINRIGLHKIENIPVFCVGDRLIRSFDIDTNINVILEPIPYRLAIDIDRYTEQQTAAGMIRLANLSPGAGRLIFAHSLLNVMRSVFMDTGVSPSCILFLVGETGRKKTTYAAFQTQLYNRDMGIDRPIRLNSSVSALEAIIHDKSDCSVVLDDLFPAKSSEIKRNQEKTLIELTRILGDNSGRARMSGNRVVTPQPRCGVIITGEYLIGTGSDAARLLPIAISESIDSGGLSQCQAEPLLLSTFYYYFINWYISRYDEIKDLLVEWLADSRNIDLGVHARLQETYYCLSSAYKLFLQYCVEKGFASVEIAQVQIRSYNDMLLTLVKKQDERVNQSENGESEEVDYLRLIRTLYKSGSFHLADDIRQIKDKHDGLIYKERLCLRGVKLMDAIHRYIPTASQDDVVKALLAKDALMQGKDKRSIQISGGGGIRFYAIPLKKLKQ